jgi:hypothetical protein
MWQCQTASRKCRPMQIYETAQFLVADRGNRKLLACLAQSFVSHLIRRWRFWPVARTVQYFE